MNDVTNRFGFSENAVHGRVPGPFVPLQDEPHEVTGVRAKKTTKTVLVPQISTISRLRRMDRTNYSVDQVVALCIALQLPPWLSSELLSQAGLVLRRTRQHRAYRLILDCMFMDPLDTVQSFLKSSGCEELKLKAT